MKIAMLEPLGIEREYLTELSKPIEEAGRLFVPCTDKLTDEELKARIRDSDAVIIANSPLAGGLIRSAEKLKYISVGFTGVDHVDRTACLEKGIRLSNAAGYCTDDVAELALCMMIDLLRSVKAADLATRESRTKAGLPAFALKGKIVGIIGTGAIGCRVAELCKAFGCKVIGYSRHQSDIAAAAGIEHRTLEEIMSKSDIVTLHVPLTEWTHGMINADKIALMKKSAYLINCARGAVVDIAALANALNAEKIAGAAIDVYENEPPIAADHPLLNAKNTLLTPHIAFYTKESMQKRAQITINNVMSWINGDVINEARLECLVFKKQNSKCYLIRLFIK